jgi:hypothetical protein
VAEYAMFLMRLKKEDVKPIAPKPKK